jgi:hypothetical protein
MSWLLQCFCSAMYLAEFETQRQHCESVEDEAHRDNRYYGRSANAYWKQENCDGDAISSVAPKITHPASLTL